MYMPLGHAKYRCSYIISLFPSSSALFKYHVTLACVCACCYMPLLRYLLRV